MIGRIFLCGPHDNMSIQVQRADESDVCYMMSVIATAWIVGEKATLDCTYVVLLRDGKINPQQCFTFSTLYLDRLCLVDDIAW